MADQQTPNMEALPPHERDAEVFRISMQLLRERKGWTQNQLATELNKAGLDEFKQITVARTERGDRAVKLGEAGVIARVLGASVEQMLIAPGAFKYVQDTLSTGKKSREMLKTIQDVANDIMSLHFEAADLQDRFWADEEDALRVEDLQLITEAREDNWHFDDGGRVAQVVIKALENIPTFGDREEHRKYKFLASFKKSVLRWASPSDDKNILQTKITEPSNELASEASEG